MMEIDESFAIFHLPVLGRSSCENRFFPKCSVFSSKTNGILSMDNMSKMYVFITISLRSLSVFFVSDGIQKHHDVFFQWKGIRHSFIPQFFQSFFFHFHVTVFHVARNRLLAAKLLLRSFMLNAKL